MQPKGTQANTERGQRFQGVSRLSMFEIKFLGITPNHISVNAFKMDVKALKYGFKEVRVVAELQCWFGYAR